MKHILLVDDDADMRGMIARWLQKAEYRVTEAASGEEALLLVKSERPDLVLLDYVMPKMSGVETLRALRATEDGATLPVAFLTGADGAEIGDEALTKLHPLGCWSKSAGKRELLAQLAKV